MRRFVGILVLILVAGIPSSDAAAQEPSRASSNLSLTAPQRFKEIDHSTKAIFAILALIAPKTLRPFLPLYTYKIEDLNTQRPEGPGSWRRGFAAIVCRPHSETEYTGYPIVSAKPNDSTDQESQLTYRDIQSLVKIAEPRQSNATTATQPSGQAGNAAANFRIWQGEYCSQDQNTLLLGTSYPIDGVEEAVRLLARKDHWNSTYRGVNLNLPDPLENASPGNQESSLLGASSVAVTHASDAIQ